MAPLWIWESGAIEDIAILVGEWCTPKDINNPGAVVGGSETADNG